MSPAPAKTSYPQIILAARSLIETVGLAELSMQTVADRVGIRAPSLYKHVQNRAELVRAVAEYTLNELRTTLEAAMQPHDPVTSLRHMAITYRHFAHQSPTVYRLLFSSLSPEMQPSVEASELAAEPLLKTITTMVGSEEALKAARTFVAFMHGFVSMELTGAFRLGGSVDSAFKFGVETLIEALQALSHRQSTSEKLDRIIK